MGGWKILTCVVFFFCNSTFSCFPDNIIFAESHSCSELKLHVSCTVKLSAYIGVCCV